MFGEERVHSCLICTVKQNKYPPAVMVHIPEEGPAPMQFIEDI